MEARNKFFNITMAVILAFTMVPVMAFASDDGDGGAQGGGSGDAIVSTDGSGNGGTVGNGATGTGTGDGVIDGTGSGSDNGTTGTDDGTASGTEGGQPSEGGTSDGNTPADGGSSATVRDAQDWTGLLDDLKLDASLQFADPDPTLSPAYGAGDEGAVQSGSESADPAESGDLSASDGDQGSDASDQGAAASVLPDSLSATLTVQIELDPQDQDAFVRTGDWFRLTLPDGFALADASATVDVVAVDDQGNATETRVGKASLADGQLKVEFASDAPESALSEEALAQATQEQAQAALVKMPASADGVLRAQVELQVTVDAALLSDQPSTIEWVLQQGADGTVQTALLELPARSELEQLWQQALDSVQPAQSVESAEAETPEAAISNVKQALATARAELQSTTTYQVSLNKQVSSIITWCDNNYGSRPSTEILESGFIPYYAEQGTNDYKPLIEKDATGNWCITDDAMRELHLEGYVQQLSTLPLVDITQTATNTYEVLSHALPGSVATTVKSPSLDDDGNPIYNEDGEQTFYYDSKTVHYDWKLIDTNTYEGYVDGTNSKWDHQYKMLTGDVEFNVIGKVGGEKLSNIFGDAEADDFRFSASIDNKPVEQDISVAEAIEQGLLEITDGPDGTTCVVSGTLPVYDENGYPIVYYVRYDGAQEGPDYYQATYDNSASANHGGATGAVYDGGTLTLRHAGTTTFDAAKVWLDNGSGQRPETTFTLWRYSSNEGSAATASQVSLGSIGSADAGASANASEFVTVTLSANSGDPVDLGELLRAKYGAAIDQLPKYDPDGYPYIYALREESVADYEQVFGTVGDDGSVTPSLPTYEDSEGEWVTPDDAARSEDDRFTYNQGTISNRLTGTKSVQLTKAWEIAAFQDAFQNVVCTFQAQSRPLGSQDDAAWTDVTADGATQELTDWNAETLIKTVTASFPKYDARGNELEYRWIESGVALDGQDTDFVLNDDGTASFQIQVSDPEGTNETLEFTSTPETEAAADGSVSTLITNTFQNTTDQHVDKYWEQPDGELAQIAPDPGYTDGEATMKLYRDGVLISSFTLDGKTDENPTSIDGLDGATWQETRSYHGDFENLPKYSPEGVRYTYLVLETPKEGWHTERSYDPDTRTTRIDNYFPEGEGSEIRVTKKWLDGDDAAHRYDVRIELVAARSMESQGKKPDGTPNVSYEKNEVVATVTLSADELWYAEVDVPIGGLTYKDFTAREVALVDDKGTPDTADDAEYPVLTRDKAQKEYSGESWVNAGWTNPDNLRVATPEHVYEVKSTFNESMGSCEVTNRRLGLLDIEVDKEWKDGLGSDADGTRPNATLTLSCLEYDGAFSVDDEGNLQVSVSGNTLPVTDADGGPVKAEIVDADGNPAGSGSARIEVDASEATSTYEFNGLPKYDANGLNVHYTVEEAWTDDQGDYRSTKTKDEYTVKEGERHFQDTQDIVFENGRTGTRDVVFYKIWHDNYVSNALGLRPDIYLTLYRVAGDGDPEPVTGYIHFSWSAIAESGDAANEQKVTISGLPKYASNGVEYTYYASESMPADGTSLGCGNVQFDYGSIDEADEAAEAAGGEGVFIAAGAANAVKVDGSAGDDPKQDGAGWAIREDGTFVNRLSGNLAATGTKLWENVPGNVEQGDLPDVTVYLQQKLATEADWPDAYVTKNDDGTWAVSNTVASTSELEPVATNQYRYSITADDKGDPLPRYNENGDLYAYRAIEIVWGLLDQPGGFTENDLKDLNLSDVCDGTTDNPLAGDVYTIQHGATGSFLLRNVYDADKGNLTVKKLFSGREADETLYPDVTFNVYRYYVKGDGVKSDPARVASHTLTQADFQVGDTDQPGNGSATYTFENLEIYAPDGSRWIYFVTETDINGYETTVGTGDLDRGAAGLVVGEMVDASGAVVENGSGVAMRSKDLGTFDQGAITASVISDDESVDVTFANNYNAESANLTGTKVWNDHNNVFNVRPTELKLEFTRTAGDVKEPVEVQSTEPDGANYFKWTKDDTTGDWTFALNNIEKWAPNGQAWTYTVKETLPQGTDRYYSIVTGESSVAATSTTGFELENALNGQATVQKLWVDGDDPYGLRPKSVTVRLQARMGEISEGSTEPANWDKWQNAYDVWKQLAREDALAGTGLDDDYVTRTLSASNGWRGSWTRLPMVARDSADDTLYRIEYRAVEKDIGDQTIAAPDGNGTYSTDIHPYRPSQVTTPDSENNSSATTVTNTLEDTSISATKTWENDGLNGTSDAWGTRPGSGTAWTATYFLQRKTNGTDWEWVVEAGSKADPSGSATQVGVVSLTITGASSVDAGTATWESLPEFDTGGNRYSYRVVEQVPGSYDVTDQSAVQVDDADEDHRYYVVSVTPGTGDDSSSQAYTNTLRTTSLTGTKIWDGRDTGIAPSFDDDKPTMVLYRQVAGGTAEQVKLKNGSAAPQPEWTDNNDGTWTFTYTGLPAADENDKPYTYWAEEQPGSVDGWYPVYETADADGTTVGDSGQTGTRITNVATLVNLEKTSDFDGDTVTLRNIELSVLSADGKTTYAIWTNGDDGKTFSAKVWPAGTADTDTGGISTDGSIVGLKAGDYLVRETGTVPEGYAKAPDMTFHLNADGTATAKDGVATTTEDGVSTVTVTVEDPVLRGHLELAKYVSEDGKVEADDAEALEGATFDLYRVDMDGDSADELIASGLTTDANGKVTTVGNGKATNAMGTAGGDLTYDGKYTKLSDGLPEGQYYFMETATTPGAVLPEGEAAKSDELTITQKDHYATTNAPVSGKMANENFGAEVKLVKFDKGTGDPIDGAVFSLKYRPEGSADAGYPFDLGTFTTQADPDIGSHHGIVCFPDLEKGSYLVEEVSNPGYSGEFQAKFTISNKDDGHTYVVWQDGGNAINFTVTKGENIHGFGIPNNRLTGQATLRKLGSGGNIDATFELQMKQPDGSWATVASDLSTGNSYELAFNADGVTATANDTGDLSIGQLQVAGLTWHTYRFVETATAPGYELENENGQIVSTEFAISRETPNMAASVIMSNQPTSLELNKSNEAGQGLEGAEFAITPVGDTQFADGITAAKRITTNGSGLARLSGQLVVGGTYEIYESAAPTGYDPVDATFRVTVQPDGALDVVGGDAALPAGWSRADLNEDGQADDAFSFMAVNRHMDVELVKVSSSNPDIKLDGVTFRLTGQVMDDNDTTHTYVTDADGAIHITEGLMAGVDYTLTEDTTHAGYIRQTEPLRFHMTLRGEIEVDGQAPEGWSVNDDKISFTVENDPVNLQITKHDPEGNPLFGAVFRVTPVAGSKFADGSAEPKELRTGMEGSLYMGARLMVGGTYDITEVSAPEGYEKVPGIMRVKVADDGSIGVLGSVDENGSVGNQQPPAGYKKVDGSSFEVQVVNQPIEIGLVKVGVDDAATKLAAAQFQITGTFAGGMEQETRTFSTNADGTLTCGDQTLQNLSAVFVAGNEYTIVETAAPGGYKIIDGQLTFRVTEDGRITTTDQTAQPGQPGFAIGADSVTIMAIDEPFEIQLTKLGSDTGEEPLSGAVFELTGVFANADGSLQETSTRVIDAVGGAATIDGLVASSGDNVYEYQLVETVAPDGYEKVAGTFTFAIDAQGNLSFKEGDLPQGYAATAGTASITVTDEPHLVSMVKQAPDGDPLEGAQFTVEGPFLDGERSKTFASDAQGTVFEGLQLAGSAEGVAYTVTETEAPEGYQLPEQSMQLLVFDDGTVKVADSQSTDLGRRTDVSQDDGTVVVTVKNEPVPGTLFAKTGDVLGVAGLGALGVAAIAAAGIGVRRMRRRMAVPNRPE